MTPTSLHGCEAINVRIIPTMSDESPNPTPGAKASFTTTTMSFINSIFNKARLPKLFGVEDLENLKTNPKPKDSDKPPAPKSTKPHRETKLYQVLLTRFSVEIYGEPMLERVAKIMHEMCFFDSKDMLLLTFQDFRECVDAYVEKSELKLPEEERQGLL